MKNVKKLFTLFILLISAIFFNHQSFSKRLTKKHFGDYQNTEDSYNLQNDDDDEQNDDGNEIENDDDLQNDDDDVDDITTEEEQKDEFLMLKIIFFLVFIILIILSISFCIYLLFSDKEVAGWWVFDRSLEEKFAVVNSFFDFNNVPKNAKLGEVALPMMDLGTEYLEQKKEQFKKRDFNFYRKIDNFLNCLNSLPEEKDSFYYYLLKVIVPEYSDRRGFPSFFEKKNGRLEFGHSLINSKKNKLYQMTENGGSFFNQMVSFLEEGGNGDPLDFLINELREILRVNSYLNFNDRFRFRKEEIDKQERTGWQTEYIKSFNDFIRTEEFNREVNSSYQEIETEISQLQNEENIDEGNENQIEGNIDKQIKQIRDRRRKEGQIIFEKTYGKQIASDIRKLIYFLFCRCLMNIVIGKYYPEQIDKLVTYLQSKQAQENNIDNDNNNINNINNIGDNDINIDNKKKTYSFSLMPRTSSTYDDKKDWEETLLGKRVNGKLYYKIEIEEKTICSYLLNVVKFISGFANLKLKDHLKIKKNDNNKKDKKIEVIEKLDDEKLNDEGNAAEGRGGMNEKN